MRARCRDLLCLLVFGFGSASLFEGPVNINMANTETLALELTGVGPALVAAIIDYREANGDFTTPEALSRVSGIGDRIIEMNRHNILVNDS
jgi:competence protein ComEA